MLNTIIFDGRLGQDPELTRTRSGEAECTVSLANTRKWKEWTSETQFEVRERTTWLRVRMWGAIAEQSMRLLGVGDLVTVSGEMRADQYKDKDGQSKVYYYIHAQRIEYRQLEAWGQRSATGRTERTGSRESELREGGAERSSRSGKRSEKKGKPGQFRKGGGRQQQEPEPSQYNDNGYTRGVEDDDIPF
jgi:single-strand DNA-binding protein